MHPLTEAMQRSPWMRQPAPIFIIPFSAHGNRSGTESSPPNIVYRGDEPVEYGVFPYQQFGSEYRSETFDSVCYAETYYATKSL